MGAKICTLCTIQNVEGKGGMRMGNSMKPAGAKACAFRGRIATFIEEKETEKASSALMVLSGRVLAQAQALWMGKH